MTRSTVRSPSAPLEAWDKSSARALFARKAAHSVRPDMLCFGAIGRGGYVSSGHSSRGNDLRSVGGVFVTDDEQLSGLREGEEDPSDLGDRMVLGARSQGEPSGW